MCLVETCNFDKLWYVFVKLDNDSKVLEHMDAHPSVMIINY